LITTLIGKEGNKLLERVTGELTDVEDYRNTYPPTADDRWHSLVLPVLQLIRDFHGNAKYIAAAVDVTDRQVRNWLNRGDVPHAGASHHLKQAKRVAVDWATEQLRAAGQPVPDDPDATLYAYLRHLDTPLP
jgi:hypothetical protein